MYYFAASGIERLAPFSFSLNVNRWKRWYEAAKQYLYIDTLQNHADVVHITLT